MMDYMTSCKTSNHFESFLAPAYQISFKFFQPPNLWGVNSPFFVEGGVFLQTVCFFNSFFLVYPPGNFVAITNRYPIPAPSTNLSIDDFPQLPPLRWDMYPFPETGKPMGTWFRRERRWSGVPGIGSPTLLQRC